MPNFVSDDPPAFCHWSSGLAQRTELAFPLDPSTKPLPSGRCPPSLFLTPSSASFCQRPSPPSHITSRVTRTSVVHTKSESSPSRRCGCTRACPTSSKCRLQLRHPPTDLVQPSSPEPQPPRFCSQQSDQSLSIWRFTGSLVFCIGQQTLL